MENSQKQMIEREKYVSELALNENYTGFFMLKSSSLRTGSNGKVYLDLVLGDSSGEIGGKKWDVTPEEEAVFSQFQDGDLVKAKVLVTEWNGSKQLRVARLRKYDAGSDEIDLSRYIKAAPEVPQAMYEFILGRAEAITDKGLSAMCVKFLEDNKQKLLYYPAAMRNHHAELGGLLYHIKRMLMMGEQACLVYDSLDRDWITAGVILHDMEKLNEIESSELGISPGYSFEGKLLGHIAQGVKAVEKLAEEVGLEEEKKIMLEHMVLAHHYEPEYGSPVRPMFIEAEVLHYLDMADAKLYDFEDNLAPVLPGQFSERVRTLDNRMLYKPTFGRGGKPLDNLDNKDK